MASRIKPNWGNNSNLTGPTCSNLPMVLVSEAPGVWTMVPLTLDVAEKGLVFAVNQLNLDKLAKVCRMSYEFEWHPLPDRWYRKEVTRSLRRWCSLSGMSHDLIGSLRIMTCKPNGIGHRLCEIEIDCITPSIYCIAPLVGLDRFSTRDLPSKSKPKPKPKRPKVKTGTLRNTKEPQEIPTGGVPNPRTKCPPEDGITFASVTSSTHRKRRKGHNKKSVFNELALLVNGTTI
ncbi:hypothetical protein F2P79_025700 [Pimephales promelas]|nr:hypothetical protein F2P79_025700 [Pimephales promelas]